MNKSELEQVGKIVQETFPQTVGKRGWSPVDWSIFGEKAKGINITVEQAKAALREMRATDDKYPAVNRVLDRLRATDQSARTEHWRARVEGEAKSNPSVLSDYRRRLAGGGIELPHDCHPLDIVRAYWRDTFRVSMRIRGTVPDDYQGRCVANLIELGRCSQAEADEWCYLLVQDVAQVPILLDLAKRRGKTAREIERMAKSMEATA